MSDNKNLNRRKFLMISAGGLASAGLCALGLNGWRIANLKSMAAKNSLNVIQDPKAVFAECGTCSHTLFTLMNNEFGHPKISEGFALDPLAGGILNTQHQCGMLWGAALAIGAESYRRCDNYDQALYMAMTGTRQSVDSFVNRACSANCRDIIGADISNAPDIMTFMVKAMPSGFLNMICMNLAEEWYPEAFVSAKEGLSNKDIELSQLPRSCASEVVKRMGGSEEEQVMVAGFAGGIGCSGNGCGALGAAIWYSSLNWCRNNPDESGYKNPESNQILKRFKEVTDSEMFCNKISGENFTSVGHHCEYINNGGCEKIIDALVEA